MSHLVINAEALDMLRRMPDACVDALVTDPPAGIAFMGKDWDRDKGGRDAWIAWLAEIMREALRVLKPGAHGLVWALPRTSHWTATALEDAGFEVRDVGVHLFGTGFPKSMDVSKAIDKAAGATREVVGMGSAACEYLKRGESCQGHGDAGKSQSGATVHSALTAPATPDAERWAGWGTALKPGAEHWILVRKPLGGTVAANVLEHGTGAINVDATRIPHAGAADLAKHESMVKALKTKGGSLGESWKNSSDLAGANDVNTLGRWPANVTLEHSAECRSVDEMEAGLPGDSYPSGNSHWVCHRDCPVRLMDEQSGQSKSPSPEGSIVTRHTMQTNTNIAPRAEQEHVWGHGDTGGASRFFYCAKPSTKEREAGCEALPKKSAGELVDRTEGSAGMDNPRAGAGRTSAGRSNHHPTVKSIALMRWLVRMITPPGGLVLDPFTGSGTTGCAAILEGANFLGSEQDAEFVAIAEARIAHWK